MGRSSCSFPEKKLSILVASFRFSMVMKFLGQRPSLDRIHIFISGRWGLFAQPVILAMRKPRNVFFWFSFEEDFFKAMSHESSDIDGVSYQNFQWTVDF